MRCVIPILFVLLLASCESNVTDVKIITFDVFGALMDLDESLNRNLFYSVGEYLTEHQIKTLSEEWMEHYGNSFWQYNSIIRNPGVRPAFPNLFRLMLDVGLDHILLKMQVADKIPEQIRSNLYQAWGDLIPWNNTGLTLKNLHSLKNKDGSRRFKLAILSNGDRGTLENAAKIFKTEQDFEFDYILGSTDAGIFKPDPDFYKVVEDLGFKKNEVLHVAGSQFDAVGAKSYGYNCAWNFGSRSEFVNLIGRKEYEIDFYLKSITDLKEIVQK